MKITAKQYAASLFESIKDAPDNQTKAVVGNFARVLAANNDIAQIEKIVRHFNRIWNEDKGIVEVEIVGARKLDNNVFKLLEDYVKETTKGREINLAKKIDVNILGGVVLKYGDRILDSSLKTKLSQFSENLKL